MNADPVPEAVAARPAVPTPADDVLRLYTAMLRVRRFEERCVELYSAARIRGFMHVYIGEEAVAAGVCDALRPDDAVVATYREHGHALLRGMTARAVMAEMFGKVTGCCRGRGGSMHLFDVERRFFGGNAIVGGGLPVAVGLALADRMLGLDRVTVCFFGEGAMAEGEWHESMNLAALWRLPVLFVCENNLYAMGTALDRSESETNLAVKAAAYEVPAWTVDGMDVLAVADHARRAVEAIRGGAGPHFLEARTYRFRAHSMYDPERYRPKDEVARWRERDPLGVLAGAPAAAGVLGADVVARLEDEVRAEVDDAVTFAEESPLEDVADLLRWVVHPSSSAVPLAHVPTGSAPSEEAPR
jgi:pyruvate dehydrogenase E1 component alpha subunit